LLVVVEVVMEQEVVEQVVLENLIQLLCQHLGTSPLANPTGLPVSVQSYPITVGAGGAGAPVVLPSATGTGSNSIFSTITSAGGGGGGVQKVLGSPGDLVQVVRWRWL
jgi:hypothetical protein